MRVGIIIYGLEGSITGIGRYTVEVVKALHKQHDQIELVLMAAGGLGPLAALEAEKVVLRGAKLLPALMTIGSLQIPRIAHQHKLDVVHDPLGVAPLAFGTGRAKSVTTIHDVVPLSFPGVSTRLDSLIYKHWLPRITPRLDAIITVSEASKQDIMRHYHRPDAQVHAIPNAADSIFKPATSQTIQTVREKYHLSERYILFVGSVEERKNLRRVLAAYGQLMDVPQKLVIVGPKKWKYEQIMTTLTELHLEERVVFTGYVEQADLPVIYSGADVFVYPSLYEGFGLPLLEAMACGVPVITSNVSSLPEVVGEAGLKVDPYDVDALAQTMRQIITDNTADLRQQGLERASQFSWQKTAQAMIAVYEQLL